MPLNWGLYAYVERKEMPAACADTAEESKQPFFFFPLLNWDLSEH